jgi:hypothetical protein
MSLSSEQLFLLGKTLERLPRTQQIVCWDISILAYKNCKKTYRDLQSIDTRHAEPSLRLFCCLRGQVCGSGRVDQVLGVPAQQA